MSSKRRALALSITFALAWLVVLLAGADHPPPVGFLGILPFIAFGATLVYWRAIVYACWKAQSQPRSMLRALAEGAIAGLAFAAAISLLPWVGEPSVRPSAASFVIWLGVASTIGSLSALLVYLLSIGHALGSQQSRRSSGA
jgi:hypothetical protein